MTPPCPHHKPITGGYFKYEDKAEKGQEQRQCPTCLRWFFRGEYGKGWKTGVMWVEQTMNLNYFTHER